MGTALVHRILTQALGTRLSFSRDVGNRLTCLWMDVAWPCRLQVDVDGVVHVVDAVQQKAEKLTGKGIFKFVIPADTPDQGRLPILYGWAPNVATAANECELFAKSGESVVAR
jgi:hypothetical protein